MNAFPFATARLHDLAIVEVSGPDAATFLQGQLTQDIATLSANRAVLAGYCSPKGRLMASMIVWHADTPGSGTFHALVKQNIAQEFARALSKFVMRAKVTIRPGNVRITGITLATTDSAGKSLVLAGTATESIDIQGVTPDQLPPQASPYDIVKSGTQTWIAAPCAHPDIKRWWLIDPHVGHSPENAGYPDADIDQAGSQWQIQDMAAGLGWVVAGIQEAFIPQTLNMDLIGGVSFTKGCYPGQEIVARSHYRGTVKRRMAYGTAEGAVLDKQAIARLPGADIFNADNPDAPCGRVINAAGKNPVHLLFEVRLADLNQASFRLQDANGPVIKTADLPYPM